MRRKRQQMDQRQRQMVIKRLQRNAALNDAISSMIVFIAILIIVALLLSSAGCVVTNPLSVDPSFQGMAAQATITKASEYVASTKSASAVTAQAVIAAQNAAVTGTAVSAQATVQSAQATATHYGQETAVSGATATSFQQSQEAIALEAQATRSKLETNATATAISLATTKAVEIAARNRYFWIAFLVIFLIVVSSAGYGAAKVIHRNAATVRGKDGNVIFYRNVSLVPDVPDVPQLQQGGHMTANGRNGARGVDRNRPGKTLFDAMGREVFTFTGRQLDKLENNITVNQDMGFRRNDSNNGYGLDGLLGIKDNDLYGRIIMAMRHAGYLKDDRGGLVWTDRGMTDFLEMNLRPYSETLTYH